EPSVPFTLTVDVEGPGVEPAYQVVQFFPRHVVPQVDVRNRLYARLLQHCVEFLPFPHFKACGEECNFAQTELVYFRGLFSPVGSRCRRQTEQDCFSLRAFRAHTHILRYPFAFSNALPVPEISSPFPAALYGMDAQSVAQECCSFTF